MLADVSASRSIVIKLLSEVANNLATNDEVSFISVFAHSDRNKSVKRYWYVFAFRLMYS